MKRSLSSIGLICFLAFRVVSQEVTPAFQKLDQEVRTQQGGWAGDKSRLSTVFDEERRRLGEIFESELLKYIASDAERHYFISYFLAEPSYLHGSKPLPYLSLLIQQQGLSLLRGKTDEKSMGRSVSFNIAAAITSQKLGFSSLAIAHKNDAERLMSANSVLTAYAPIQSEDKWRIYNALKSDFGPTLRPALSEEFPDRPKVRVIAGVLNNRATSLPVPVCPVSLSGVSGEVVVDVVFDESGKVIWSHALSGPDALQKCAEDAASRAKFPPFRLQGKPEKVSGVLIYWFLAK